MNKILVSIYVQRMKSVARVDVMRQNLNVTVRSI